MPSAQKDPWKKVLLWLSLKYSSWRKRKKEVHNRNFRMGSKLPNGHAILTTRQTTNKWQKQLHSMRSRFEDMWEMLEVFSYCLRWSQLLETSFRSYERSQKKILGKIWRTYFKVFACLRIDTSVFKNTEKQSQYLRSFPFPISLLLMVYLLTPFTKHQQASSSETSFA